MSFGDLMLGLVLLGLSLIALGLLLLVGLFFLVGRRR